MAGDGAYQAGASGVARAGGGAGRAGRGADCASDGVSALAPGSGAARALDGAGRRRRALALPLRSSLTVAVGRLPFGRPDSPAARRSKNPNQRGTLGGPLPTSCYDDAKT